MTEVERRVDRLEAWQREAAPIVKEIAEDRAYFARAGSDASRKRRRLYITLTASVGFLTVALQFATLVLTAKGRS